MKVRNLVFICLVISASSFGVLNTRCEDGMSFAAGQVRVEEKGALIHISLRTAGYYPATTAALAGELGISVPDSTMPIWAEVTFPRTRCIDKTGTPLVFCQAEGALISFSDYFGNSLVGTTTGHAEFKIDTFTRDSLDSFHPDARRVEANLTVTNDKAYRRAAVVEMAAEYCKF